MQNDNSNEQGSRARKSKSSYGLKIKCLIGWINDHKAFKPKPTFLPENVGELSGKFKVKTHYKKR